mmetsp:Transcript_10352/g.32308  ORF Transcript_10352/g.32308 Transcript_10352/m.32308 type:complete len:265 (-) Transcript_10352:1368-2162(-)
MTRACPRGWRRTGRAPEPEPLLEPPSGCGAARGLAEPAPDRIDRHAVRRQLKRPRDLTDHFRVVLVPIATQAQRCLHADHMHDDATPCSDAEIFVLHRRRHNRTDVHVCKTGLAAVGLDKLPCCLLELLRHDVVVFHECLEVDSAHRASVQERDLTTGLWISCEEAPQRIEGVEHDHDLGCSVGHSPSDAWVASQRPVLGILKLELGLVLNSPVMPFPALRKGRAIRPRGAPDCEIRREHADNVLGQALRVLRGESEGPSGHLC